MIIIAFSKKTSKILPKLFCKNFRHCSPVIKKGNFYILYQFVKINYFEKIILNKSALNKLEKNGWLFVKIKQMPVKNVNNIKAISCVSFTKKFIRMKNIFIQTPDALYKKLKRP